jgi:hypothetical protein
MTACRAHSTDDGSSSMPPKEDCSMWVSFESLKGICPFLPLLHTMSKLTLLVYIVIVHSKAGFKHTTTTGTYQKGKQRGGGGGVGALNMQKIPYNNLSSF